MQPLWLPKELFAKESIIINFAFAHVTYFFFGCISLNILLYLQYKYFLYSLCNIGIQFDIYKFTHYMDSELVILY
jgi:hypothetical protein